MNLIWVNQKTFYLLERLVQFYLYDLSKVSAIAFSKDARYEYDGLELYIQDSDLHAYLIEINQCIVGFVLLNQGQYIPQGYDHAIHGLYLYPLYRGQHYASQAMKNILEMHPGHYFVPVLQQNNEALHFWKKYLEEQKIRYIKDKKNLEGEPCIIFDFSYL